MPLSEREQRILEEIERNLSREDPRFAREVRKNAPQSRDFARVRWGAVAFAAGFLTLLGFFYSGAIPVGVLAFGLMVGGAVLLAGGLRGLAEARKDAARRHITGRIGDLETRLRQRYRKPR